MRYSLIIFLSLISTLSFAELRIEVTKGVDKRVQVAVVPFEWRGKGRLTDNLSEIIDSDFRLSGRFETTDVEQMLSLPRSAKEVFYRDWKLLKVEYLLIGYIKQEGEALRVHYELYNIPKQSIEVSESVIGNRDELRDLAHHVSDVVFEKLTGIEGAFSTRIMYVTALGPLDNRIFRLNIADADGHRVSTVLETKEPILSATWAPDGNRIAYVSFERDSKPSIYVQDLSTHSRIELTRFAGLNSAPAFSPDGKRLALVLSKTGNPDIWIYDLESRTLRQLTRHYGIDTEPSWSADGQSIVFTSSRGGKPQIYKIRLRDLKIERLTFEGDYNARARLLPDGSGLVMVHRRDGNFYISLLDLRRGRLSILTETTLDESPSIAPNGSMLIYATQFRDQGILAAVSIDGGIKFNLPSSVGDVREPAWSPKKRKVFTPISE
jgi:TolB protein